MHVFIFTPLDPSVHPDIFPLFSSSWKSFALTSSDQVLELSGIKPTPPFRTIGVRVQNPFQPYQYSWAWVNSGALFFFFPVLDVPMCALDFWYLQKCLLISSWAFVSEVVMSFLFDVSSGVDRDFSKNMHACVLMTAVPRCYFSVLTLRIPQKVSQTIWAQQLLSPKCIRVKRQAQSLMVPSFPLSIYAAVCAACLQGNKLWVLDFSFFSFFPPVFSKKDSDICCSVCSNLKSAVITDSTLLCYTCIKATQWKGKQANFIKRPGHFWRIYLRT